MSKKDRIPNDDLAAFVDALRLMSEYGEEVIAQSMAEVLSTNFTSGVRGIELVYKTIEGLAGSAKTAPAWDKVEPLVQKYSPPKTKADKEIDRDIAMRLVANDEQSRRKAKRQARKKHDG